ncbi:GroES-like protein [Periconia macrospinosa]|uniref:GroES-like protein n=1 Tax=Periconia macrospinosa TaxID=97972 RepID=A0A2V1D9Z9_9PLEO|nr:GroES-like protein [Periconia macrospinosa]
MPTFTVYKGRKDGYPIKSTTTKPDELTGDKVLLKVTASGLCGTDLHFKNEDMVLGHEGVGIVEALGPEVKHLKVGDRVGWGYETNSCGDCMECIQGYETFCPMREMYSTANLDQGSFASHAIWREAFLHPIPEGMSDEAAAPLQCGGATTFTALTGVKPTDTVGIMGVGGLGHLAIQFASKMGCKVIVFSGSDSKKSQALTLGAHEFVAMEGKDASTLSVSQPINRLIVTTSVQPNWELMLPLMAFRSVIYPLSVSLGSTFEVPYMPLMFQGIAVQGSLVATRTVHRLMLEFAARHGIAPVVETFPMSEEGIRAAMEKLEKGKVQFRAVLVNELNFGRPYLI